MQKLQIEIVGQDAETVLAQILEIGIEGIEVSYEISGEGKIYRTDTPTDTLSTIAAVVGIASGMITIAKELPELKRNIFDCPEPPRIEWVVITLPSGDRHSLKNLSSEEIERLSDEIKRLSDEIEQLNKKKK